MTPKQVAEWMWQELQREKFLYQDVVVFDIESKFGSEFTYINNNGNSAIDKRVLEEFRKITGDAVVWERGQRMWRMREDYDPQDKRQAD